MGMSQRAMTVPEGGRSFAYGELFLLLPREWNSSDWWPIELLRQLARYPHERETWLACGHIVQNGHPPRPFRSDVPFSGLLLTHPVSQGAAAEYRRLPDGRLVRFYQVVPLYHEELQFARQHGSDALLARFAQYQTSDVLDPGRRNVCRSPIRQTSIRAGPGAGTGTHRPSR
jgi:hypothetical protein